MRSKIILVFVILILVMAFIHNRTQGDESRTVNDSYIWEIRSIDTMKTSRDKARAELNNSDFDVSIQKELDLIKDTGANYVAVGTPYDEEFLPYLKRWVHLARERDLKVWFRGNWSSWEGWFEYPKNLSPEQHLVNTRKFIVENSDLFEDGDIFDSCPECENAGYWVQPERNREFNEFIRAQAKNNAEAFSVINKNVHTNLPSIIGGRAKEVLDANSIKSLNNIVTIDHYISDKKYMESYLDYFEDMYGARVLVSEFGAPIPDINGPMNEGQQAEFINSMFDLLYRRKENVLGINYYVSIIGTTPLLNEDYTPREAYYVVKNYFSPGIIKGVVQNSVGDRLADYSVTTEDKAVSTKTNENGEYVIALPPQETTLIVTNENFKPFRKNIVIKKNGERKNVNFTVEPENPEVIYKIRQFLNTII